LEREGYRVLEPDPRGTWYQLQAASGEDWTGQKVAVVTWRDELAASAWTLQAFNALRIATLLVLLAMLVTGIMNISWIAIRERTREIGALRAIGMQRAGVLRMFMVEALLLGALAAAVGVGVGVLATLSINAAEIHVPLSVQLFLMRDTVLLLVQPRELLGAIALITSVTCCAAVLPSLRAARLLPVQALAHQR
jgi:ABC-type lipoprotein release transport system permease subunit